MKKFIQDCKGAVTVMVTLLLIPAILITGTGVDIARIYTAKSVVQDANQLAANSVLASYDALLQDLYGLFGVMQEDDQLAEMVDDYLKLTILGEDWNENGTGTFQLFYGSQSIDSKVASAPGKNLGQAAIFRRQIEEYSKFRAPAIVVEEVLDKLDTFERVQEDAKVIQKKMELDDGVEEVDKVYREIYACIEKIIPCEKTENDAMDTVDWYMKNIRKEFTSMYAERDVYTENMRLYKLALQEDAAQANAEEGEEIEDLYDDPAVYQRKYEEAERKYKEHMENVHTYIKGGNLKGSSSGRVTGLEKEIADYTKQLNDYIDGAGEDNLTALIRLCEKADNKKQELKAKLQDLKTQLNSGKCTENLRDGLQKPVSADDPESMIEKYEKLLEYALYPMAKAMYDKDVPQIQETITLMENAGLLKEAIPYTWSTLKTMGINSLPIDYLLNGGASGGRDDLYHLAKGRMKDHQPAGPGFKHFNDSCFDATRNASFYNGILIQMCKIKGDDNRKDNAKKSITKVFEKAQDLFKDSLVFTPEGAEYLTLARDDSDPSTGTDFGTSGDWSKENEGKDQLKGALDDNFLSTLTDAAGAIGNKALLMVYSTEMFSNYASPRLEEEQTPDKTMAGIPLSTEVNYYYHSEQEYLYNGNLTSAHANLASVAGMILLVRFVFNYVASFTVSDVQNVVNGIRTSLAGTGPFAILASELARMGLAIGESAMDVERLRNGENVSLFKTSDTWRFSVSGLVDMVEKEVVAEAIDLEKLPSSESKRDEKELGGLTYTDYLRLFLLLVNEDDLSNRIIELIQLNLTNYSNSLNADESAMASAERFDLSKARTDFSITTKVEMRMLFLSMPFAQKGINGVIPPKTMPLMASDYRGY